MAREFLFLLAVGVVTGCHTDPCSASSACFELKKTTRVGAGSKVEWSIEGKSYAVPIVAGDVLETKAECALAGVVGRASGVAASLVPTTKMNLRCPEDWQIGVELDLGDLRDRVAGTTTGSVLGRDVGLALTLSPPHAPPTCRLDVGGEVVALTIDAVGGRQPAPTMVTPDYRRAVTATLHVVGRSAAMVPSGVCPGFEATLTLRLEETAADWKATPSACVCE